MSFYETTKSPCNTAKLKNHHFWRQSKSQEVCQDQVAVNNSTTNNNDDGHQQGNAMGIVLVPILLSAMAHAATSHSPHSHHFEKYSLVSSLAAWILFFQPKLPFLGNRCGIPVAVTALAAALLGRDATNGQLELWSCRLVVFVMQWWVWYHSISVHTPAMHSVVTHGEWVVVTSLVAVAMTEFTWNLLLLQSGLIVPAVADQQQAVHNVSTHQIHPYVIISGLFGCVIGCSVASCDWIKRNRRRLPVIGKLAMLVLIPLVTVEMTLMVVAPEIHLPRSLVWLTTFLLQSEEAPWKHPLIPVMPRAVCVVYWALVLLVTLPLAPTTSGTSPSSSSSSSNSSASSSTMMTTIVARKWFHLIAILLFAPVVLVAPQLLSLALGVAWAVLMVLECVRHDWIRLNQFYARYLDLNKDGGSDNSAVVVVDAASQSQRNGTRPLAYETTVSASASATTSQPRDSVVIVSHMALIVGCAAPLWIAEWLVAADRNGGVEIFNLLLSTWGIWSLGVGDSMGALVGCRLGRLKWRDPTNKKTMEGSLAMFLSMALICGGFWGSSSSHAVVWVPTVLYVTLLEAFTRQIDNLVLPLAGATIILLCQRRLT